MRRSCARRSSAICFARPAWRRREPRSSASSSIAAKGVRYLGLYTLVEVPDEPMLEAQFGSEDGNLYKPNGTGARWTQFLAESFPKKTNQRDEDWTDVQDAIAVLERAANVGRGLAVAPGSALRGVLVPALARAEHDHRQHRHLWRLLAAQLLGVRQPASS